MSDLSFVFPIGPREGDVFSTHKVDTVLCDQYYYNVYGVWHTGEDWNGKGGGDSDLGDPVYSIAEGVVIDSGFVANSWGNIILIEHVLSTGTKVWSQYAHLDEILVSDGTVAKSQQIGTIGKGAQDKWIAHLHFEIRRNLLPMDNWLPMVRHKEEVLKNYFYPTLFIQGAQWLNL